MNICFDTAKLKRYGLDINDYLALVKHYIITDSGEIIDFTVLSSNLEKLIEKGYINKNEDGEIYLDDKALDVLGKRQDQIDFDEIFDMYPQRVIRNGRSVNLRPANKLIHGRETHDYAKAKKAYLSIVRTQEEHEEVKKALGFALANHDLGYMPALIVYINQRRWERDLSLIELKSGSRAGYRERL